MSGSPNTAMVSRCAWRCVPSGSNWSATHDVGANTNAVSKLQAWLASPYRAVGLYLGGRDAGCPTSWSPSTAASVRGIGWKIIPIYVDLQAPCFAQASTPKIPSDPAAAYAEGITAANGAHARMVALGISNPGEVIHLDIEAYTPNPGCTSAVRAFTGGWVDRLHALGYLAGLYSSTSAAIADLAAGVGISTMSLPDVIWFAAWGSPPPGANLYYGCAPRSASCPLPDNYWSYHQRIRQYLGGHDETHGGVTMNIDSDNVEAPVVY